MRALTLGLLLLPFLSSLGGCCSLFHLFGCAGEQPLMPISHDSPKRALRTFLAGIRFSDSKVIYESLSEDFRREHGIDILSFAVGWDRIISQNPFLRLAGEAAVMDREIRGNGSIRFTLAAHGQEFRVDLAPVAYWELARTTPEEESDEGLEIIGSYVSDLRSAGLSQLEGNHLLVLLESSDLIGTTPANLAYVRIGVEWKVRRLIAAPKS
ncbi:MAG: hypothetical protein ACE5F1_00105 [Planctomycetota bacterium]